MALPAPTTLPTSIDATYTDDPANPSRKLHQQNHDAIHVAVNGLTGAGLATTAALVAETARATAAEGLLAQDALTGLMQSPPTVTVGGDNVFTAIPNGLEFTADSPTIADRVVSLPYNTYYGAPPGGTGPAQFEVRGGEPVSYTASTRKWIVPRSQIATGGGILCSWSASFVHDGAKFAFAVRALSQTTILIKVNGQYVSLTPTTVGSNYAFKYVIVDFGSRDVRDIEIIGAMQLGRIMIGPTDTIELPPRGPEPRWFALGDSYFGSTGADSGLTGVVQQTAKRLGWTDVTLDAIGGTAFLRTSETGANYLTRAQSVLPSFGRCDGFLLSGSINDDTFTTAQVQAQSLAVIDAIRALYPDTPIVIPVFASEQPTPTGQAGVLAAHQAAAASRTGVYVVSLQSILTGTGTIAAPTGVGNSSVLRWTDGAHPTQDAHDLYAARIVRYILTAVPPYTDPML